MLGLTGLGTSPFAAEFGDEGAIVPVEVVPSAIAILPPAVSGVFNDDAEGLIRKHLPMAFRGPAWSAIIAALATGDAYNFATARSAFDQLFLVSASGIYLDRRAGREGLERPASVGMSDDIFRRLAIEESAGKLTYQSLVKILEIFYGTEAVAAHLTTLNSEPYRLENGSSLIISDGREELHVTFPEDEFREIDEARAVEVAAAINRACARAKFPAVAAAVANPSTLGLAVRVYSHQRGLGSLLTVTGGLAQNVLRFPTAILALPAGTQFDITNPDQDIARYAIVNSTDPLLLGVREGDTVNIIANIFDAENRGSFRVRRVRVVWNGSVWEQWFEVENESVVVQGMAATNFDGDLEFFRPTRASIYTAGGTPVVVAQAGRGRFDISLPVTTQVVGRRAGTAAYLPVRRLFLIDNIQILPTGVARVTTTGTHGLTAGGQTILEGLLPSLTVPSTDSGNPAIPGSPGTTDASWVSIWSSLRSESTARSHHAAVQLTGGDALLVGGEDGAGTALGDCALFTITSGSILTSGVAEGRERFTYEWNPASTMAFAEVSAEHRLTALNGSLADSALLTGGRSGSTARSLHRAQLYAAGTNTWTDVPNGTLDSRYGHVAIRVEDAAGDDVVYVIGGLVVAGVSACATVQRFRSTAGGTIDTVLTETEARYRSAGASVSASKWVVAGGAKTPGTDTPRSDCLAFDELTNATFPVGPLSIARMDHVAISPAPGKLMVIGGIGRNLANETSNRVLGECEILDIVTGRWRPAGRLAHPRRLATAMVIAGSVYVFGGLDGSGDPVTVTEIFDIARGRWTTSIGSLLLPENGASVQMPEGIFHHGGHHAPSAPSALARLFVEGSNTITPTRSLSGLVTVASIIDSTHFTFAHPTLEAGVLVGGRGERMAAAPGPYRGPYVWDPMGGAAVTATATSTTADVDAFAQYETLRVADATAFPDAPGWLAVDFGLASATFPVPYLGRASDTELLLDYGFRWPRAIGAGASVVLLAQRHPFTPETSDKGAFYLTASSSGRIAAQLALDEAVAGGLDAIVTVQYPGDKGLGGEGQPVTGAQKISDRVYVWGGDSPDTEIAAAREG